MPSLNFKRQFAAAVESGAKTQTIRAMRKSPILTGDKLHLFTGMRTAKCRKLAEATATMVREISINESGVKLDGTALAPASIEKLAKADGFGTVDEFRQFFRETHGFPFRGQLIQWGEV
jgi:hypothetical protein